LNQDSIEKRSIASAAWTAAKGNQAGSIPQQAPLQPSASMQDEEKIIGC
jgi:hypothetical protein